MSRKTNAEVLTELMEFSRNGIMMQLFIVDTLEKQARAIAEMSLEDLKKAFGGESMISAEAWHATAKELHQTLEEHLRG